MTGNGAPPLLRNPLARITFFLGLVLVYQLTFALAVALIFFPGEAAAPGGQAPETPPFQTFAGGRDTAIAALSIGGMIALTLLGWRLVDRRPLSHLGLLWTRGEAGRFLLGIAAGGGVALLVFLIGTALRFGGIEAASESAGPAAIRTLAIETLVLLAAAASEEMVFRGYLLANFLQAGGPSYAVAFSSILFATLHALNPHFFTGLAPLNILLIGGVLALTRLPAGGLALPIGLHFGWNFLLGPVLALPVSGFEEFRGLFHTRWIREDPLWSGGAFGPEGGLVSTLPVLILVVALSGRARARQEKILIE